MKTESCSLTLTGVSHALVPWLRAQGLHCPFSPPPHLVFAAMDQLSFTPDVLYPLGISGCKKNPPTHTNFESNV